MDRTNTARAGAAGIVWAIATTATALATGQPPKFDAPVADIRSYLTDHRGAFILGAVVFALTVPLLLWFGSALATTLRAAADDQARVASGAMVGGVCMSLATTGAAWALTMPFVLQQSSERSAGDDLIRLVYVGGFLLGLVGYAGLGTALAAFGIAARTTSPAWLTRSAVVIGALTVVAGAVGLANAGAAMAVGLAFVLAAVWVLAAGISMLRDRAGLPVRTATVTA